MLHNKEILRQRQLLHFFSPQSANNTRTTMYNSFRQMTTKNWTTNQ